MKNKDYMPIVLVGKIERRTNVWRGFQFRVDIYTSGGKLDSTVAYVMNGLPTKDANAYCLKTCADALGEVLSAQNVKACKIINHPTHMTTTESAIGKTLYHKLRRFALSNPLSDPEFARFQKLVESYGIKTKITPLEEVKDMLDFSYL